MAFPAKVNFVRQQGFREAPAAGCDVPYGALMFQPRLIGCAVAIGIIFQSWPLFLALSAILWWNVLIPTRNPFDAFYNHLIAGPQGLQRLAPAPAPRRFAQGMAGSFMLGIGVSLLFDWRSAAWVLEAFLVVALVALIFGKLCIGSYLFHLLRGDATFANHTLPWSRTD